MDNSKKRVLMATSLFPSEEKPYYCVFLRQLFDALKYIGYHVSILMPDAALPVGETVRTQVFGYDVIRIGQKGNLFRSISGRVDSLLLRKVTELLTDEKPDIIDIHFGSTEFYKSVILAGKAVNVPVIMHYHGLNVYRDYYVAHPLLEKMLGHNKVWIANHADGIVGVSNKVKEIVHTKSENDKVYTVYNGVDPKFFYPAEKPANDVFTVICIANLIPIKGHEYLLRAVHNICFKHGRSLKVRIIGGGPEKNKLQSLTAELGIEDTVEFLGEKNYDVVAREVRAADFFVLPSYFESLGCVYLEAMASNVAVLGVNGCGIDEIIINRENGYLVDPRNVEQIEESILYAMDHPEEHKKIARKGYQTVLDGLRWEHSAAALDRVYRELLDRSTKNAEL